MGKIKDVTSEMLLSQECVDFTCRRMLEEKSPDIQSCARRNGLIQHEAKTPQIFSREFP